MNVNAYTSQVSLDCIPILWDWSSMSKTPGFIFTMCQKATGSGKSTKSDQNERVYTVMYCL
jgi:hypothetical protein